jgi:hypothetical protein
MYGTVTKKLPVELPETNKNAYISKTENKRVEQVDQTEGGGRIQGKGEEG